MVDEFERGVDACLVRAKLANPFQRMDGRIDVRELVVDLAAWRAYCV